MAVPSTTSSVIVGSGWFCALLVLGIISADSSATKSAHRRRVTTEQPEPRTERPAPTHDERPPEFVARRPEFPPEPVDSVETHTPAATPTHSVLPTAQPGPALPAAEPAAPAYSAATTS